MKPVLHIAIFTMLTYSSCTAILEVRQSKNKGSGETPAEAAPVDPEKTPVDLEKIKFSIAVDTKFTSYAIPVEMTTDIESPEFNLSLSKTSECSESVVKTTITGKTAELTAPSDGKYYICSYLVIDENLLAAVNNGYEILVDATAPTISQKSFNTYANPFTPSIDIKDANALTYLWSSPSSEVKFSDPKSANPTIEVNKDGAYEVMLIVTDFAGNSSESSFSFTQKFCSGENLNATPFANSGKTNAGTEEIPFKICTLNQLNEMRTAPDKHFELSADIDATETTTWGNAIDPDGTPGNADDYFEGFEPIGNYCVEGNSCSNVANSPFIGSFDGKDYTITGLYMKKPAESRMSLFKSTCLRDTALTTCLKKASFIKNVTLANIDITGGIAVASLASFLGTTPVENIHVSGEMNAVKAGGLFFEVHGTVENVSSSLDINATANPTGGICSALRSGSTINNASFTGTVTGGGDLGGICGYASGTNIKASNLYSSGNVISIAAQAVGGIFGAAYHGVTLTNAYVEGNVTASHDIAGGVIGRAINGSFKNIYMAGTVQARSIAGGILGSGDATTTIENCFFNGTVTSTTWYTAGGIVGKAIGDIKNCYSAGTMNSIRGMAAGILGDSASTANTIENSYSSANITATGANWNNVAGLVGAANSSTITASFATGDITLNTVTNNVHGLLLGSNDPTADSLLHYLDTASLTNQGVGSALVYGTSKTDTYFQGPLSVTNEGAGQLYENWDFVSTWEIANGELPKLRCPTIWPWDCPTTWDAAQ